MLVLSRKPGESIAIGNDILIRVVHVHGQRVRLAIDAPKHVPIMRTELAALVTTPRALPHAHPPERLQEELDLTPDFVV